MRATKLTASVSHAAIWPDMRRRVSGQVRAVDMLCAAVEGGRAGVLIPGSHCY